MLNMCELNILNTAIFMHKVNETNNETAPATFFEILQKVSNKVFKIPKKKIPKKILLNVNTEFQPEEC